MDKITDEPVISSDTSSLYEDYEDNQERYSQENVIIEPHTFADKITGRDIHSQTSTDKVSSIKEREKARISTKDRKILTRRDMVPTDEKKGRDSGLITSKQAFDDTAEYNRKTDKITDEPVISSNTSSLYEDYKDDQEMYSQENVIIEPHTFADKITDRDIHSQTSTDKVSSTEEREKARISTKDRKILTTRDMVPTDKKKERDSGLITSKQAFDDTAEYNRKMDKITDEPVISSDTSSLYEDYKDNQERYSQENVIIEPHTFADKITGRDIHSQTSTDKVSSIKEREKARISTKDRKILTRRDMVPTDEKKGRDSGLITSKQAFDDTAEYNRKMDKITDEPVISSDTSSLYEDYKDDQERYSQENVIIEPHTFADKITDRDIHSQTSTDKVSSIKEREKARISTKDRKIFTRDMVPTDEKKARDSGLITSKQAFDDTAEYNRKMDKITDEPVISSDTSSLYEDYKDDQERYSQENVIIEPHTFAEKITDKDIHSQTSTDKVSSIKERENARISTKDRKILTTRDMVPTDEKKERDSGLITSKQAFDDTAEYNRKMDKITDEPVISSNTSSLYEDYKDDQEMYSRENVIIEPHTFADKITDRDIHSQTSTDKVSSIKEREKARISTKDRKILTTRDMVPTDKKKERDSGLITSKQAFDDTAEYNRKMDKITDEPVISSDTSSLYEDYKDNQERYSQENVIIEPHTFADKITDRDIHSQTSTDKVSSIKEREKARISTKDRKILTTRDMIPTDEKKERDSGLITSKQAFDDTAEYNRKMDKITDEPVISSDTSSLYQDYKDNQERYSQENVIIEPHTFADKITDRDIHSQTSTDKVSSIKEREKARISTKDRKILTRDMVPTDEKKARDSGLISSQQAFDDTAEYNRKMDKITDEPVISSDTSSLYEDYKDDQERYSQENVIIEPHTFADKITDRDIHSQTSTDKVSSIKEREKARISTKDRKILTTRDMVSTDEKKARDSGLITSKQVFDDTAEYNRKMDKITDEPVISSDTISLYEDYKDDQERYSQENVIIEPHTFADKITDTDIHSQTSTDKVSSIKEREKARISTKDRKFLTTRDMVSTDEKKARDSGLITSKQAFDDTAEYNRKMDKITDEPVISSDTSSLYDDYKDDQERYSQENVIIEPHTFADKITDRDIHSQTSTDKVSSIKEREKARISTKDRKILTTRDMVPTDKKKERDSGLITSKQAFDDTAEYNRKMDKITDEPVISSDTSSLYEDYKDNQERYSQENVIIEPHTFADKITGRDIHSHTSTDKVSSIKEREKARISTKDRKILTRRDMVPTDEKKGRDSGLITSKQAFDDTAEYNRKMDKITDEPVISSDTSSLYEDYKDDQERYSQENVIIEPHSFADKITDRDIHSQTSTDKLSSIKEREKARISTKDRKILTTRDMVPTDEKKERDSGLITSKQAFDDTAEYNRKMDKITDEPVISSDTSSLYEDYKDNQERYSQENVIIEPHTFADKITDRDIHSQTSTDKVSSIKEREKARISTKDRKILTRDMVPTDEKKARDSGLITSKQVFDDTAEYNRKMDKITDEPVISSDTISLYEDYEDDQERYSQENVIIEPHTFADKITDTDIHSQTSTDKVSSIKDREKARISTKDRKILTTRDMVSTDEKKARDSGLITSKQTFDDTAEYNRKMDKITDEPVISSDTISLYEDYKDDQERYSQENIIIEPHTFADKITDTDIHSQTSTDKVSSIKEREKARISTKDRKFLTTRDMVSTDEKKARDSGLITSKQAFDDTAEYNRKMDKITDEPVISSDTSSLYDDYKDDQERYSQENVIIEPHTFADKITDTDIHSQTSTEKVSSIKEREKARISTKDRKILTTRDMVSTDEKKERDSGLITSKQAFDDTAEYNRKMDKITDEPVISSDTSSLYEDYKDDQERCSQENVIIEPHTFADKITDRDIHSQTSTAKVSSIKEREKVRISTKDRKILTRDMVPTDKKKERDSGLISSKQAFDDTAEYNRKMDKITDEPVISSDTSSLYEDYKDDQERYRQENVIIEPHSFADKITDRDIHSQTSTDKLSSIKEREKARISTKDRKFLTTRDMVSTDEKKARDSGLITSKQAFDDTAEYNRKMDKITDEPVISSDTSSLYKDYKDNQERYSQENVIIEPHTFADKITDRDIHSQTSTDKVSSIKEREKARISTKDRKILTRDMVPTDEKKARDSGLISSKQAFDDTAKYNRKMDKITDEPVISSDTSSFYEHYKDNQVRYSQENVNIEPHTIAYKITDTDIHSQTSTEKVSNIKEREKAHTSTKDRKILTSRHMVPTDEKERKRFRFDKQESKL
ncbi:unnamed protein product [Mytilus coruscus]|uniref:Uncharacterized protein n=2 Tax=Mytilus coruscus TaxID=42192 RepID=A0A6J8E2J5_MYTCO|nr:unnamed protein product [Mytilus coruscus]